MSTWLEYVKQVANSFPVSRPVFVAQSDERNLYFNLKCKTRIESSNIEDPIVRRIANCCTENLRKTDTGFEFVMECNAAAVYMHIVNTVKIVYERNCGLKQPRQSRMYKWIDSSYEGYNHESHEGFIALYRYIAQHATITSRYNGHLDKVHADNVIAVLERMRNKYEDK